MRTQRAALLLVNISTCVQGGPEMTDEQLAEVGANDSLVHVDFMIGEATTNITGYYSRW